MRASPRRIALFPGTFDPMTYGHLDLIKRGLRLFDHLILGVAPREEKGVLFKLDERVGMARAITARIDRAEVLPLRGLLVDFAARHGVHAVIRGLRAVSDFEYELQMALMNRKLRPQLETVFLMPSESFTYLNSTVVKEIARLGGDVSAFVPPPVVKAFKARVAASGGKGRPWIR